MILPVGAEGIVLALGFQFSLEKILELRERLEQQAAAELSRLKSLEAEEKEKLAMQRQQRQVQLEAWRNKIQGTLDLDELDAYRRWLEVLDASVAQQQALVEELQLSVKRQTDEYLAARRKRQVLEKLREHEYERFCQELLRKEQRELDDIAATRFVQREASSS